MAVTNPNVPYNPVPSVTTQSGGEGGGDTDNARATPEAFGAGVGQAVEKAGETGVDAVMKQQGLINETLQNNAEVGFIQAAGNLKAKYTQYEGLQAEAMRPQYEAELAQAHAQFREALPPVVQKSYDATTTHQLAYQTGEFSQYAAVQIKTANLKSQEAVKDTAIAGAGNLGIVQDDNQFNALKDTIRYSGNTVAGIHGDAILATGEDAKGNLIYPDTPEGKAAEARHMQYTNDALKNLYITGAKTIADNEGAAKAADWAQKHWDEMPDVAKVQMNQYLAPKMKNEVIGGAIHDMVATNDSQWSAHQNAVVPDSPLAGATPGKTPLDVIRENEGYTGRIGKDSNGANVLNGINEKAFPAEYAEVKNLLDTKGKAAADAYSDNFYQKNIIDKYGVKDLPAATQAIVADGLVNHGTGAFGQSLVVAAKNGATPQQLIDMRYKEYHRLADSDTDGSKGYAASIKGWDNRLESLEPRGSAFPQYPNKADFLRDKLESSVSGAVNTYLKQYPDDYYGSQIVERRARAELTRQISNEDNKLRSDRDVIQNAIGGGMTKGQMPATYDELHAIPGMAPILDRVHSEQGEFASTIDTRIAKASRLSVDGNSPNAFETIGRVLQPQDESHPNHIKNQSQLDTLLGKTDTTGINMKDYNDAKPATELDTVIKDLLLKHMQEIAVANGNIDGKGQMRAVQWYNQQMTAYKQNQAMGDKKMDDATFASHIGETDGPLYAPPTPSRMTQISNWAKEATGLGHVKMKTSDGTMVMTPAANVEKAIKAGYEKVE